MTASSELPTCSTVTLEQEQSLLRGEVLISTTAVAQGASVTATMYVPMVRQLTWQKLTDYSQWVQYFPDIVQSQVLEVKRQSKTHPMTRRLYQVARKAFLMFSAQVEIYLQVIETLNQKIQFRFERGTFSDFAADLTLEDYGAGTLITYSVKATPLIPVPSFLIEQAIRYDLPGNMKTMRQVMCAA
ncbi:MAG: Polyketide cyclase / dehydrase and lipid transport [Phormidesmis priestleyi Ana]|uniref:Polyketide cyclase / dehydrase and lipid transport n=1 Tax=Phormidesmis priestleyi Ana TaxID=1666911 RepID=A0A0P8C336_9CYAN|nr:MAG: Polyketide cyclase / dehydrase and lipid transport [Phormidesmis priestleyi Ana]